MVLRRACGKPAAISWDIGGDVASSCSPTRRHRVSPFIVGALMASYQLPGVVWLMIGLLVIRIVVVWAWGVEPRNRALEEVAAGRRDGVAMIFDGAASPA